MNEEVSLYFKDGSSDKEYHAQLEAKDSGFVVNFQYGRRGAALQSGTKTAQPLEFAKAKKVYDKLVAEKTGKGYTTGVSGIPYAHTPIAASFTGVVPQLLNPIEDTQVATYIADDNYVMQEKYDGEHFLLHRTSTNTVLGANKKGIERGYPECFRSELDALCGAPCVLDGEIMGEVFYVFDVLLLNGQSIRNLPYADRLAALDTLFGAPERTPHIVLVKSYYGKKAKQKRLDEIRAASGEGVVFKLLSAPSTPGKATGTGPQVKHPFRQSATCEVGQAHASKRSVSLILYEEGKQVSVGNVTIPVNQEIPNPGDFIEVRYLYAYRNGSIYQPVYLGKRRDQDVSACVTSQLKYKPDNYVPNEDDN
jgi:bifunctional non-homologous end joining protein LigD